MFYLHGLRDKTTIYNTLFSVCALNEDKEPNEKPFIDMSFTYLNWNVIEQLAKKKINIEDISQSQLEQIIFNILPGCETVLHRVWKESDVLERML